MDYIIGTIVADVTWEVLPSVNINIEDVLRHLILSGKVTPLHDKEVEFLLCGLFHGSAAKCSKVFRYTERLSRYATVCTITDNGIYCVATSTPVPHVDKVTRLLNHTEILTFGTEQLEYTVDVTMNTRAPLPGELAWFLNSQRHRMLPKIEDVRITDVLFIKNKELRAAIEHEQSKK